MSHDSSRREFLTGRSALRALADAQEKLAVPMPAPAGEAQTWLTQISREAMACEFEILLDAKKYPAGPDAAVEALDLVEALEVQLTIYRDTSEVSRLNQKAFEQQVGVEERLFEIFVQARELWQETGSAFDITSGALTKIWGFYRRQGRMPSEAEVAEALAKVGSQHLELDASTKSVRFLVPDLEINLGAIGKGHTLDRCAELLGSRGIQDFVIHGGNSSVLARGVRSQGSEIRGQETEVGAATGLKSQISNPKSSSPSPQPPAPSPPPPLVDRPPPPASARAAAGGVLAARSGARNLRLRQPVLSSPGKTLRPHPRPPHRLAGGTGSFRDGHCADRR